MSLENHERIQTKLQDPAAVSGYVIGLTYLWIVFNDLQRTVHVLAEEKTRCSSQNYGAAFYRLEREGRLHGRLSRAVIMTRG